MICVISNHKSHESHNHIKDFSFLIYKLYIIYYYLLIRYYIIWDFISLYWNSLLWFCDLWFLWLQSFFCIVSLCGFRSCCLRRQVRWDFLLVRTVVFWAIFLWDSRLWVFLQNLLLVYPEKCWFLRESWLTLQKEKEKKPHQPHPQPLSEGWRRSLTPNPSPSGEGSE